MKSSPVLRASLRRAKRSSIVPGRLLLLLLVLSLACRVSFLHAVEPLLERVPGGGLQPQVAVQADGSVHLVYLAGEPSAADVMYRVRRPGETEWSAPIRVNSQPGSGIATGTIRGAQLALGRGGRVHVVWNGSSTARPKPSTGGSPLLYARLEGNGQTFSPQHNLMTLTHDLDGGGSVAADGEGRVFVAWHGAIGQARGETNRAVFLALSTDDGRNFAAERRISPAGTGACGCCGLAISSPPDGNPVVLFRTARTAMQRDMLMIASTDHGQNFVAGLSHPWAAGMCPMSSASLLSGGAGADRTEWAAWETAGAVYLGRISGKESGEQPRRVGPSKGAKHPRIAANSRGELLVVWTEGTGWQRGGLVGWQAFDVRGEAVGEPDRREGVPVWGFAAAYARPDGRFVILY